MESMDNRKTVLVVDDNQASLHAISRALERAGYAVFSAQNGKGALELLETKLINIVVTDLKLPDFTGETILEAAKKKDSAIAVIVISAYGTIESAVEAMKKGAYYFLKKPISISELRLHIERALEKQELEYRVEDLSRKLDEKYGFGGLIGVSPAIRKVFEQIRQVAPTRSTVLIQGESGTGKELIARAIHHNSERRDKPFLAINCSAISSSLLESELFGHEKGAFTGAISTHKGYFEVADTGTIFLDEIGDMPMMTQAKILRVLEAREFLRVGGTTPSRTDVRIIAATNVNLENAVVEKNFREDLYYRLKVFNINVPPLKERKEDIPYFVEHFLKLLNEENGRNVPRISKEAMECIIAHDWPGNVRELKNFIERASITIKNGIISLKDLPATFQNASPNNRHQTKDGGTIQIKIGESMDQSEKRIIEETLLYTDGNRTHAAKILKIGLRTLQRKMKRFNLA
ncbi:sigma-54-dependent Fis family transcriptional regulator [candidate division KSB1 bacterium]|nr:sigma-54-dependent Fis family transcriptional regulator [candidate division KSB1 bacterium]